MRICTSSTPPIEKGIAMEKEKLNRINELAAKVKRGEQLTEAELEERAALRTEYIREFRASMTGILDNTVIVRPDGTREQVVDRPKSDTDKK